MNIQESVDAPRFHHQWLPDQINVEQWFSLDTANALRGMGHKVEFGETVRNEWVGYWSDGECIAIDPKTGDRLGAPDGRNNGKAVGY